MKKFLIYILIVGLSQSAGKDKTIDRLPAVIKIRSPYGVTQYTHETLYALKNADTASYTSVMRIYQSQCSKIDSIKPLKLNNNFKKYRSLPISKIEILTDDFGNTATIYYYKNGFKSMDGDIIYQGQSYRKVYNIDW